MSISIHRNWEPSAPEITGKFYFSGTLGLGGIGLSFEPHSIKVNVIAKEDGGLKAIYAGQEVALTNFQGRWLGPEPESETWQ